MRIPSGVTDQFIYFVAVDSTDLKSRETGLNTFTVYRSRDGGVADVFTTPTVNETDATNMPGVYELLLDEDMTIDAGNDSEEICFHITHAGMAPVTRTIELYEVLNAASVKTQILNYFEVDTFTEIGQEAIAATNTLAYMIRFLFKSLRNDYSASATFITLFNDDGTTAGQKWAVAQAGGTLTRDKVTSGA